MPYDNATWLANNEKELKALFNGNVYSGDAASPWQNTPAAGAANPYKMYSAPGVEYDPGDGFNASKATNLVYGPAMQAEKNNFGQMGPAGGGFGSLAQATFGSSPTNTAATTMGGNTNGGGSSVDWPAIHAATTGATTQTAQPNPLIDTLKNYDWGNSQTGDYFDQASGDRYMPIYGQGTRNGEDYTQGPITGYQRYANGQGNQGAQQYNGSNYDTLDTALNKTGGGQFSGLGDKTMDFIEQIMPLLLTGIGVGAAGGLSGLFGGSGAATGTTAALPLESASILPGTLPEFGAAAGGAGAIGTMGGLSTLPESILPLTNTTMNTVGGGLAGLTAGQVAGAATTAAKVLGGETGGNTSSGNTNSGNLDLNSLAGLFGGGLDWYNQNKASTDMLNYLKERQAMTDKMYSPGSPEATALWDEMSRKDAAAGRNSQYGPRSVDLAARIAKIKSDANTSMTTGLANVYANALNQKASAPAGLMSAIQSGGLKNALSMLGLGGDMIKGFQSLVQQWPGVDWGKALETDYYNGKLTAAEYQAAATAAQLDSDPDLNGSIADIL